MYALFDTWVERLARLTAIGGGLILLGLIVMTCLSIIGRQLIFVGLGPIPGDFEMVELGVGLAIFAFLPWCHYKRGHATVELFLSRFSPRFNHAIDVVSDGLMLAIATTIAWRLWIGMLDKKAYTETTFILQLPVWLAYAGALVGAVIFTVVAIFCVVRSARNLRRSRHDKF